MKTQCCICNQKVTDVLELPEFPLTGMYAKECSQNLATQTLVFQYCENCGHAQLGEPFVEEELYGTDYTFRTSESATASKGVSFFKENLQRLFPKTTFKRILDVGCNDCYLLEQLSDLAEQRFGVDLIWENREDDCVVPGVKVFGKRAEDVDLENELGAIPDLIVSQHTMEHIEDPESLLRSLLEGVDERTHFLFEFPSLDMLVRRYRFDQVFHQHVQYYSVASFGALLNKLGAEILDVQFNEHYWGAVHILFKKAASPKNKGEVLPLDTLCEKLAIFRNQMSEARDIVTNLNSEGQRVYGYGAALMLPSLFYYLGMKPADIEAVYDDDPSKSGLTYANLDVKIERPDTTDFSDKNFLLTAIDNRRPILKKLIDCQARTIINPINVM